MPKKAINGNRKSPKSIPRTQADVDRAKFEGKLWGMEWTMNLIMFILRDKHHATDEEIDTFNREFKEYNEQINNGNLKYHMVKDALKFEYDTQVRFT